MVTTIARTWEEYFWKRWETNTPFVFSSHIVFTHYSPYLLLLAIWVFYHPDLLTECWGVIFSLYPGSLLQTHILTGNMYIFFLFSFLAVRSKPSMSFGWFLWALTCSIIWAEPAPASDIDLVYTWSIPYWDPIDWGRNLFVLISWSLINSVDRQTWDSIYLQWCCAPFTLKEHVICEYPTVLFICMSAFLKSIVICKTTV